MNIANNSESGKKILENVFFVAPASRQGNVHRIKGQTVFLRLGDRIGMMFKIEIQIEWGAELFEKSLNALQIVVNRKMAAVRILFQKL
ncbi:MAG: hypothetical protein HQL76_15325 [Magnetococcales bacterium]|nr:hypothetical protein [Magnetococcales bacterium]